MAKDVWWNGYEPSQAFKRTRNSECTIKTSSGRLNFGQSNLKRGKQGKVLVSVKRRCEAVIYVQQRYGVSQRRACKVLGRNRSSLRKPKKIASDEKQLTDDMIRLAKKYGRYGYKKITSLLKVEGWKVNHKRVERLWRQEGLKVPKRQKKRKRLYLHDGSCIRLRPLYKNHVWSYDFVADRLLDGTKIRFLTLVDEYTRECLALKVDYKLKSHDVLEALADVFIERGLPEYIRSDNGSEFTAKLLTDWLKDLKVNTAFITPGSPWENGYNESFNGKFRDEFLACEAFYTLTEAQVLTEEWRYLYNHIRPHISLGYKPPAPLAKVQQIAKPVVLKQQAYH